MALSRFDAFMVVLGIICVVLLSASLVVFDLDYYTRLQEKHGVSVPDAASINAQLVQYFQDRGELPAGFTSEEASHLQDVKKVMNVSVLFFIIALFAWIILFLYVPVDRSAVVSFMGWTLIVLPLICFVLPFPWLFRLFHSFLFAQGTWTFPVDHLLIQLYPFGFFQDFAVRIGLQSVIIGIVLLSSKKVIKISKF